MRQQVLLQEASEVISPRENAIGGSHWKHAVAIDQFEGDGNLLRCRLNHPWEKEAGKVVADDDARFLAEGLEQSATIAVLLFQVRIVGHRLLRKCRLILNHTFDDKSVNSITCPFVAGSQSFENDQRFVQLSRPFDGALEREIPGRTAVGNHPVEDVFAFVVDLVAADVANANGWDAGFESHERSLQYEWEQAKDYQHCKELRSITTLAVVDFAEQHNSHAKS